MEKLWTSNYLKVMFANFSIAFAFYIMAPLLPIYLSETFGSTKDVIGLVLSGYAITALIIRPFGGYIVDSFDRKKVLVLSLGLYFVLFSGYLIAGSLLLFAIVRTLHGGPYGLATVSNSTAAIDVTAPSRRNEAIGYYGISNNVGTAIAPTIGIWIYNETHNFNIIFWIALIVAALGFYVDSTVKFNQRDIVKNKKKISLDRFILFKGWLIGLNMMLFGACYGVLANYLAIYGKEELGITGGTGTYFLLLSLGLILSRLQGAKSLREGKMVRNASEGLIISMAAYTIFVACPNGFGYYGSAILLGLGNGHMWPACQNMIINIAEHNERGTANSTILTSWDLGSGLGIMIGGFVAEHVSYTAAFWTVAGIHAVGVLTYFLWTRKFFEARRRKE